MTFKFVPASEEEIARRVPAAQKPAAKKPAAPAPQAKAASDAARKKTK
jgi:hypothetical protein